MANCVKKLTDRELVAALDRMAREHCKLVAAIVEHLAEVERRRLHLALGYSSLYVYATERLRLTEHEAYLRITAARAALCHEQIIPGLESGELSLTTVKAVAPHLGSHPDLLKQVAGQSTRQVQRIVAERVGRPNQLRNEYCTKAVAGGRVEITCVVSEETAALLEEALDLMMHENPERDCDRTLARALRLLVADKKKPRGRVPAKAERAVTGERRCAFVGEGGHECGETRFLELDHIEPRAGGGSDEPENLRWLCASHNKFEAERKLGAQLVERQRRRAQLERDVCSALTNLGFTKSQASAAAGRALRETETLELPLVIRAALASMPIAGSAQPQRLRQSTAGG